MRQWSQTAIGALLALVGLQAVTLALLVPAPLWPKAALITISTLFTTAIGAVSYHATRPRGVPR